MVYLYKQGSVTSHSSDIPAQCYYHGYIEGYPGSVVTLSTCSGLRGMLQFENVSYGIEPLESAVEFQHILYKLGNENKEFDNFNESDRNLEENPVDYSIFISKRVDPLPPNLVPRYLEMIVVVEKGLYDYLGSDRLLVTNKVIELISLVNSMFSQFNVTVVLSSMELWSDKNKISTSGEADELLKRFLEWRKSYLSLRPHDVAYLLIYKDHPSYVGATFPGKICVSQYSVGIALYSREMTLETFSVTVTQMLGINLGISYDDPQKCHCSEAVCVMSPKAMQSSVLKTFSNCSLSDFQTFISNMGSKCLQNKPKMQVAAQRKCGNGIVEAGEKCDCGTVQQCEETENCCTPGKCTLKPDAVCDSRNPRNTCCRNCLYENAGVECRPAKSDECDIPEFCNGSSEACPENSYIINGHMCKNNQFFCYDGICHDLDERCESYFGPGSKNAPFSCYEEIQSQIDRFGHCGLAAGKYKGCGWRNLACGRLICSYPSRNPFIPKDNTSSVVYAYVRNEICITATTDENRLLEMDPLLSKNGPSCDEGRVCVNHLCVESRPLKAIADECTNRCSGNGVCTNANECRCKKGFLPPDCQNTERAFPVFTGKDATVVKGTSPKAEKKWLLGLYIGLPAFLLAVMVVAAWNNRKKWFSKKEQSRSSKSRSEESTHTYTSRSMSEASTAANATRSKSRESTPTPVNGN
ncbi:disintegrin and metalloproteinase domain-containing protein 32 isoform 2-T2 [Thomomys bottae]